MSNIILCQDTSKVLFDIPRKVCIGSGLISMMIEDNDEENLLVPVSNVPEKYLPMIIEFLKYSFINPMPEIEKPLKSIMMEENISEWYAKFIDSISLEEILELIQVANYLDIKNLLDLCSAKIASIIKGKSPEELRRIFNIH